MHGSFDTEFTGKRALVTGGTRSMGAAIVHRLRGAGATVVTTARSISQDLLEPERFVAGDLSTAEGAETVLRFVRERLSIDMLVHNVGGSAAPGGGFAALTDDRRGGTRRRGGCGRATRRDGGARGGDGERLPGG